LSYRRKAILDGRGAPSAGYGVNETADPDHALRVLDDSPAISMLY